MTDAATTDHFHPGQPTVTRDEIIQVGDVFLLPCISDLYGLEGFEICPVKAHEGGRNLVYTCEKEGDGAKIIRVAFLNDRSRDDLLAEVEYIRYLAEHGGSVSDVVTSQNGNLLEEIVHQNRTFFVSCLKKPRGRSW